MSIMEHLRDMVSERMIVLSNMQDAAREAAEEANLDFSKFRLNGGTAGVYFYTANDIGCDEYKVGI